MINADMRFYDYYTLGKIDAYGQPIIPAADSKPIGKVKMAINISNQSIQDNINYKNCTYLGLTKDHVDDTYIISYENKRLKVLFINPKGRYKQVFLGDL